MNPTNLSLCIREDLVADFVSLRQIVADVNACLVSPVEGISSEDAMAAYRFLVLNKEKVGKNGDGVRMLEKGDPLRPEVCRMLFHIPLSNLCRREARTLETDPVLSAMPDSAPTEETELQVKSTVKPAYKSRNAKNVSVPVHTVEEFDRPDPNSFENYVGNENVVRTVKKQIDGAMLRGDPLRPLLLRGASGCGKTELARRVCRRIGRRLIKVSASVLKTADDVYGLLNEASNGETIFIEESHAAGTKAIAVLLDIMSSGFKTDDGTAREFFFIFATNVSAKLPDALKNRCLELRLNDYSVPELAQMVSATAKDAEMTLEGGVAEYISERSHGIARYAIDYTKDVITENAGQGETVTLRQIQAFFANRGIDRLGLKAEHRKYIRQLSLLGKASLSTMASALGENDTSEVEKATEPFLLKHGLVSITSNGRVLTEKGKAYLKSMEDE